MRKLRQCICLIMAAIMIICSAAVPAKAYAAEELTYRYVALGDNISSGFTLTEGQKGAKDPALILNDELLANPIKDAYPAVFGELLADLGKTNGVVTEVTNLSTTGYRADDISKAILEAGYASDLYSWILETINGEGTSAPLAKYHEYFDASLKDADLISIQNGANDIAMGALGSQINSKNPVIQAAIQAVLNVFLGMDIDTAREGALAMLSDKKVTYSNYIAAARLINSIYKNLDSLIQDAVDKVKELVQTVQSVNSHADIAVIGLYFPYDDSIEYEGEVHKISDLLSEVYEKAGQMITGKKDEEDDKEKEEESPAGEALAGADIREIDIEETRTTLDQAISELEYLSRTLQAGDAAENGELLARESALMSVISSLISIPLEYELLKENLEEKITAFNTKLEYAVTKLGATFVDIYGITREQNIDPHPDVNGHKQIANILYEKISPKATAGMAEIKKEATPLALNKKTASLLVGKTAQLKTTRDWEETTWKTSNKNVATVSKKGLVTAKGIGTATITAQTKSGKKVTCKVTVSCTYVYQCVKSGVYRYTTNTADVKKLKKAGWTYKKIFRAPGAGQKVYQIYNKTTKRYRYTTNLAFAKQMKKAGHTVGLAFYSSAKKTVPVYEYTNKAKRETFCYAATAAARKELKQKGWKENGVAWYAEPSKA